MQRGPLENTECVPCPNELPIRVTGDSTALLTCLPASRRQQLFLRGRHIIPDKIRTDSLGFSWDSQCVCTIREHDNATGRRGQSLLSVRIVRHEHMMPPGHEADSATPVQRAIRHEQYIPRWLARGCAPLPGVCSPLIFSAANYELAIILSQDLNTPLSVLLAFEQKLDQVYVLY